MATICYSFLNTNFSIPRSPLWIESVDFTQFHPIEQMTQLQFPNFLFISFFMQYCRTFWPKTPHFRSPLTRCGHSIEKEFFPFLMVLVVKAASRSHASALMQSLACTRSHSLTHVHSLMCTRSGAITPASRRRVLELYFFYAIAVFAHSGSNLA